MSEALQLAKALIEAPSITPARGRVFDVLDAALAQKGFIVERFITGEEPDGPVENLFATRGTGRHLAFAGHLDVVPPGEGWQSDPFSAVTMGDLLFGRGAVDMKGAIAAFVAAIPDQADGRISFLITGDEEGAATFGTVELIKHVQAQNLVPDICLVGEPTSQHRLGDMVKIGRRGSVNIWINVPGTQGHVAYPHLADNPLPRLVAILARIDAIKLDEGNAWFQPSNIEITKIETGENATNLIPGSAAARLSIRFNDMHTGDDLVSQIKSLVHATDPQATVTAKISGEAFLTQPGALSGMIQAAIAEETGNTAELSTTGGTSDARFLSRICPVVEFGLPNATMHKLDEAVAVEDLAQLTRIYQNFIRRALQS